MFGESTSFKASAEIASEVDGSVVSGSVAAAVTRLNSSSAVAAVMAAGEKVETKQTRRAIDKLP